MSKIDFTNPVVLRNYIQSQIAEGKGEKIVKEKVTVIKTFLGEFVCPDELVAEIPDKKIEPIVEEVIEETEEVGETEEEVVDELFDLKLKFLEKFNKDVPVNKKNNKEWIISQLNKQ
jgi:hypothetical protein